MEFLLTGNPFVDTGMYAMQAKASELYRNKEIDVMIFLSKVMGKLMFCRIRYLPNF